ncbi:MAG TPA: hypothetical protein VFL81_02595 [Candidatus Saccharimonadales bacterium]|nr:hypothetical protein [Candidatus Saccharimonadales bacterium]
MNPYKNKYDFWKIAFAVFTFILFITIAAMYATQRASTVVIMGYIISVGGLAISIPPYAYYKNRRDEMKKQEQYDVEMLGVLGQQNLDEQEERNRQDRK